MHSPSFNRLAGTRTSTSDSSQSFKIKFLMDQAAEWCARHSVEQVAKSPGLRQKFKALYDSIKAAGCDIRSLQVFEKELAKKCA